MGSIVRKMPWCEMAALVTRQIMQTQIWLVVAERGQNLIAPATIIGPAAFRNIGGMTMALTHRV
jgi:hypothetical protein